jgi:hypothetical protein
VTSFASTLESKAHTPPAARPSRVPPELAKTKESPVIDPAPARASNYGPPPPPANPPPAVPQSAPQQPWSSPYGVPAPSYPVNPAAYPYPPTPGYPPAPPGAYPPYPPQAAPYVPPFVAGGRVLVQWADGNRYPGLVQQVAQGQCLIVFPDGQQRWVEFQYLAVAR